MRLAFVALLVLVLAFLLCRAVTRERRSWRRFQRLTATRARQRVYRRWLIESVVIMGGISAVLLLATWPLLGRVLVDTQAWGPVATARDVLAGGVGAGVAAGAAVAFVAALLLPALLLRGKVDEIPAIGDVQALLPRNRAELPYGVGLGVSAGVFEETLFRLAMPALIFGIVGDGPIAFLAATVVFGVLHLYQRWTGVLFATLLGLVLSALYVLTGWIWVPIVVHALIDLRSLVVIPLALGTARQRVG
ncbi:CPBP family intramembrane glutamic endopeptidase [Pseudolysinimonas sp.]|uniref:CPBP family intramembrane glutamic endopeptidase n=1 Tax=Pseudolysinimonas sp. TaxID=2680009 RepID=UPI003F7E3003